MIESLSSNYSASSLDDFNEIVSFPKSFAWDWPFCDEGIARGMYTEEKFFVCLPFNNGGTGERNGSASLMCLENLTFVFRPRNSTRSLNPTFPAQLVFQTATMTLAVRASGGWRSRP